ncbi:MAG: sodium ion-translocating decarboxylase subunit beta [Caldisericia bacterium]|nr:sodium ion-translocating decarboxylase subunit beta [Caldisericia bacterium]
MNAILEGFKGIWQSSAFGTYPPGYNLIGCIIMVAIGLLLYLLAIKFKFEPLLLLPIATGCILVNLPVPETLTSTWIGGSEGFLTIIYNTLTKTELLPVIMFFCLGALTDFGPLLARPTTFILGAAAQFGVIIAMFLSITVFGVANHSLFGFSFDMKAAAAIGIIGGADGPTAIFLAQRLAPDLLGAIAVAAYSYMSLVPLILPPVIRALTTTEERKVRMDIVKPVSQTTKIIFPIACTIICGILLPSAISLIGLLMAGNLIRESGVVERLSKTLQNEFVNIVTILLGLSVGSTMKAADFLQWKTIAIIVLGFIAFAFSAAGGVLLGKLMYKLSGGKINPMIGAAGVSAVPMAARTVQIEGQKEDPGNFLIMAAMGPNVAGVIGTAVAAGALLAMLSGKPL